LICDKCDNRASMSGFKFTFHPAICLGSEPIS